MKKQQDKNYMSFKNIHFRSLIANIHYIVRNLKSKNNIDYRLTKQNFNNFVLFYQLFSIKNTFDCYSITDFFNFDDNDENNNYFIIDNEITNEIWDKYDEFHNHYFNNEIDLLLDYYWMSQYDTDRAHEIIQYIIEHHGNIEALIQSMFNLIINTETFSIKLNLNQLYDLVLSGVELHNKPTKEVFIETLKEFYSISLAQQQLTNPIEYYFKNE